MVILFTFAHDGLTVRIEIRLGQSIELILHYLVVKACTPKACACA